MRLKSGNSVGTASRVTKLLLYFLAGVAAMGVGTTAQQPRVVRVDSGELQGVLDDGVVSYKGNVFRGNTENINGGVNQGQNLCETVACPGAVF